MIVRFLYFRYTLLRGGNFYWILTACKPRWGHLDARAGILNTYEKVVYLNFQNYSNGHEQNPESVMIKPDLRAREAHKQMLAFQALYTSQNRFAFRELMPGLPAKRFVFRAYARSGVWL